MTFKRHGREYDIVVFGATGYTGRLTAEHIAQHLPTNLKWAVASRSESKLHDLINDCNKVNSDRPPPSVEVADINNDEQVHALAKKTYILITTVGPYTLYGEHMFKACAESGTHYLDVTGEVPWVAKMIEKYEKTAKRTGALMLPQIGIESAPTDMCTWLMAKHIRETFGSKTKDVTMSIHKLSSKPSGGTLATVLAVFDTFSMGELKSAFEPYALSPIAHPEPTRQSTSFLTKIFGVVTVPHLGLLTTSVAASTDGAMVERSWGLLAEAPSRKEEFYGPNFTWSEYYKAHNWLHGIVLHWGLIIGATFLALVPPLRPLIRRFVFQPGEGPERDHASKDEIEYRGIANPDTSVPTGKQAHCRARYEGSMYFLSGLFLAQAALTILEDDLELDGGVWTPACLGQGFIDRSHGVGFNIEVKTMDV
ncbi:hypothetical protein S40285_06597 [Stachybotrys chlorohalonatus IBT 40285]|uniref:Saccharopine dehydrogenase NADP binding domain-containing protein n=1 Tax=Stachybotrys chlorohalonatus (strain IBT 40285) TaxID=1283841 RepID=A0A084QHH1_STAC4|nr:hypothetical protein S40285_06597 [Stachybotrys chlorohalonata IBT 40285]